MKYYVCKLVVLGKSSVGKSSLIRKYLHGTFDEKTEATIGVSFTRKIIQTSHGSDNAIKLDIWDTAGSERFSSFLPQYVKGASSLLICFDPLHPDIDYIQKAINSSNKINGTDTKIFLVATKTDVIPKEHESLTISNLLSMEYAAMENINKNIFQTSAKSGKGIDVLFMLASLNFKIEGLVSPPEHEQENTTLKNHGINSPISNDKPKCAC